MANFIIGTAGHVDHGKTSLVIAMTGKDTDRLREEKERGISIELGFAPIQLPSGAIAGIIDVPGHERFIKNMLAGVGGIDIVLFVIAADEGVMPQTQEHLDIINLLQIPQGIVVITKTDMVEKEWLELVKEEIKPVLKGTILEDSPILEVSSVTGSGIAGLVEVIDQMTKNIKPKEGFGKVRLPIDRVFSITGFGTVVTGTLISGTIKIGDELEIYPQGNKTKVRSLQVHGEKVQEAVAGHRVAVNVTDIEVSQIDRGNVLASVNGLVPSYRIDTWFSLLPSASKNIKNRTRIRLYIGANEVFGRLILLDREEMEPGDSSFVQIVLEDAIVAVKNERFVVRTYSPMTTIGGGVIIDANPPKHKRFKTDVIEVLKVKQKGTPKELIQDLLLSQRGLVSGEEMSKKLNFDKSDMSVLLLELLKEERVKAFKVGGTEYYLATQHYEIWKQIIVNTLEKFHIHNPLKRGMAKEEIRSKNFPEISNKIFNYILDSLRDEGIINIFEQFISNSEFTVKLNPAQEKLVANIVKQYLQDLFKPPEWKSILIDYKISENESGILLEYLVEQGILIKIDTLFFHMQAIEKSKEIITETLLKDGTIDIGRVRDLLDTSRKYALPIMEYCDQQKITRRVGDQRVLFSSHIKG